MSFSSQSITVMPIERAVPSMIFMPASTSRADRSAILISAISRSCAVGDGADLVGQRVFGALLDTGGLSSRAAAGGVFRMKVKERSS